MFVSKKPTKLDGSKSLKITVVGDAKVGKSHLLKSYVENLFPEDYIQEVLNIYTKTQIVGGVEFSMKLWYTAGQESCKSTRTLSYSETDCFLVCYAVDNPASFTNVDCVWVSEIRNHYPEALILLVGTKSDLLKSRMQADCLSAQDGELLKSNIKANGFVQCSAKTREGLDEVFIKSVKLILEEKKRLKRRLKSHNSICKCN